MRFSGLNFDRIGLSKEFLCIIGVLRKYVFLFLSTFKNSNCHLISSTFTFIHYFFCCSHQHALSILVVIIINPLFFRIKLFKLEKKRKFLSWDEFDFILVFIHFFFWFMWLDFCFFSFFFPSTSSQFWQNTQLILNSMAFRDFEGYWMLSFEFFLLVKFFFKRGSFKINCAVKIININKHSRSKVGREHQFYQSFD